MARAQIEDGPIRPFPSGLASHRPDALRRRPGAETEVTRLATDRLVRKLVLRGSRAGSSAAAGA
jgi:hypothetical protein